MMSVAARRTQSATALAALAVALVVSIPSAEATAQDASQLTPQEKTAGFIQHLVKVARIDPKRYRALVLQYEIGRALDELRAEEHASHHSSDGVACCDASTQLGFGDVDFIADALKEIHPEYGAACGARDRGDHSAAIARCRELAASSDPYLAAYAELLRAELEFARLSADDGKRVSADDSTTDAAYGLLIARCERLVESQRLYLIPDHRASELVAKCFERLERPLLELTQYLITITDFQHMPEADAGRMKARAQELAAKVGKPLEKVAGWMGDVESLLEDELTAADPTQSEEKRVLVALDKLIELQEARERQACKNCGGGNCQGACRGGNPKGNRANNPADQSRLVKADGRVLLHGTSRADPSTIWGQLREKRGARALNSYSGKLPPRYEKLLKQYFRDLSKEPER